MSGVCGGWVRPVIVSGGENVGIELKLIFGSERGQSTDRKDGRFVFVC